MEPNAGVPSGPKNTGLPTEPAPRGTEASGIPGAAVLYPVMDEGTSFLEFINVLLRQWRIALGVPAVAVGLALAASLLIRPAYTASTTFVPEDPGARIPVGLAGLASQVGLSIGAQADQSPHFYADVLGSRQLMQRVLLDRYPSRAGHGSATADSATLLEILGSGGRSPSDSVQRGLAKLARLISTKVDARTSAVRLSVEAGDPVLAALVANRFLHHLNDFNARTRQSQARERRKFAEAQLTDVERGLRVAEQDLRVFYERNRSWRQSPQLEFEEGRLRRQLDVRQEMYLTLKREYEKARIDEVNDIPVITVVDPAVPIDKKSKPRRARLALYALVLGGLVGVIWATAADRLDELRASDDPAYREFRVLLRSGGSALRRLTPPKSGGPRGVRDESDGASR